MAHGAVLLQEGPDNNWHPVAYLSGSFSPPEWNYDMYDCELLAIIKALEHWKHCLKGAKHTFKIWTDHKNLEHFQTTYDLSQLQACWSLFLSRFDFLLSYKARSTNHADSLSRCPDLSEGVESNNKAQTLLPARLFSDSNKTLVELNKEVHVKATKIISSDLISLIQHSYLECNLLIDIALDKLLKEGPQAMRGDLEKWTHKDGITQRNSYICVPKDNLIYWTIVKTHYDAIVVRHPGRAKTLELVQQRYWWSSMTKFIHKYMNRCTVCQSTKNLTYKTWPPIQPLETTNTPWQFIFTNFIIDLPKSKGYNSINVVVN